MLDFINYPVSFILWCWHKVFGFMFGPSTGVAWVLGIIFLTFTVRAILIKPFVKQVRSMRKMQEFAPEIKKLQAKYKNDRQKLAQEMQKLQSQHGVNPLGGCLPMLLQIPVFFGLNNVLRGFVQGADKNYFFGKDEVNSYLHANLFGARLSNHISQATDQITAIGANRTSVILVSIPLMIIASVATHLTAKHNVARQNPATATAQTGMMNKITLYVFPFGVLVFGAFFPIGLLVYWLSNNAWTLGQQHLIYKKIDREEEEKKTAIVEKRTALGPKPGQKPTQPKKRPAPPKPPVTDDATKTDATETPKGAPKTTPKQTPKAGTNGTATPKKPVAKSGGGTEIPGLISDRSRSKKSGRKRP